MKKKIISFILIVALVITFVGVRPFITQDTVVYAEEFRNGYAIIPQTFDSTGINTQTTFLFKSENPVTLDSLINGLKIIPAVEFTVIESEEGYIISPSKAFLKNQLIVFEFEGVTWSFQTMNTFEILGSLPTNQSTGVPVNSGIEFYFSHPGAEVEKFFSIEPKAEGRFETHGNTVVFVPKELEEKTIYTVTLKKGLTLKDSEQELSEDYIFTFETLSEANSYSGSEKGYFSFNNIFHDFGTSEVPKIPMYYAINDQKYDSPINTKIYAYTSAKQLMNQFEAYYNLPYWSIYGSANNQIDSKGLNEVMSFQQPLDGSAYSQQFLNLPGKLPAGYYLVDSVWEDIHFQTFIQVTDLSYYFAKSIDGGLFWINDLSTKEPAEGATVTELPGTKTFTSDGDGIARIDTKTDSETNSFYLLEAGSKSAIAIVINNYYYDYYYGEQSNFYWRYMQLDRNLYQPNDTVNFFGFIQNRTENENITQLTVELSNGYGYYWAYLKPYTSDSMALITDIVDVKNGFYEGSIKLPNLEQGSYQLNIKHGDKIISSSYVQVQKYTKPAYKIDVTSDKKAIFIDEPITFTAKTSFFEGTPVSNLDVNYNLSGFDYFSDVAKTDVNGEVKIDYVPKYVTETQGLNYIYFDAYATLPESGQIYANKPVMVFVNDLEVSVNTEMKDNIGTIKVLVNQIDLDKINQSENEELNYLGDPVANHVLTGTVYKNEWKKREIGEYYDFINKVVQTQYEYYTEQTPFQEVSLTTDNLGKAELSLQFEETENCYYNVIMNTKDQKDKKMRFESYFGGYYYYSPYDQEYYTLKGEKDVFNLDENVQVEFKKGEELVDSENFLFLTAQNGIIEVIVQKSPVLNTTFKSSYVPNVEISSVTFNGKTYIVAQSFSPRLNTENNQLTFTVTTDKEAYKPDETVTVKLEATIFDKINNKIVNVPDVAVNVSVVDEALFKLSEQTIDTLGSLYEWVPSGITYTVASHKNDGNNNFGPMVARGEFSQSAAMDGAMAYEMPMATGAKEETKDEDFSGNVRTDFKDTAHFETIYLDEHGQGTFQYKLPDNVTSWRMTFAGISTSLMAGTETKEVIVTLPYFVNISLGSNYLVGDVPYIGATTFGTKLNEGDEINYTVSCLEKNYEATVTGKAFERVNLPLFEMTEGNYEIVVTAISGSFEDRVSQKINVVKTYHQKEQADYYEISNGLKISTTDQGNTNIQFVDQGKGKFVPTLYSLAYWWGKRVDQRVPSMIASELLKNQFGLETWQADSVDLTEYLMDDGGLAILPYAASDVETTVKLIPLLKDEVNKLNMKMFLQNALEQDGRLSPIILYGLASLGEPILLQVEEAVNYAELSMKEYLYLGLAYAAIGDQYKANEIYEKNIKPSVEEYNAVSRVKVGNNEDSYLEHTALAMILASALNLPEKDLFFKYVSETYSKEVLVTTELMTYIQKEIHKVTPEQASVTYSYDGKVYTQVLENGWPVSINIPSSKINDFVIQSVSGKAALIAIYNKESTGVTRKDDNLQIDRQYLNYYTNEKSSNFIQSDIVKVKIDWRITGEAIDDIYTISDYLPSGLVPIESPWSMGLELENGYSYSEFEGQKVTFYVSKYDENNHSLYYYARIVSPGTFHADGMVMQGVNFMDSMRIEESDTITILE